MLISVWCTMSTYPRDGVKWEGDGFNCIEYVGGVGWVGGCVVCVTVCEFYCLCWCVCVRA